MLAKNGLFAFYNHTFGEQAYKSCASVYPSSFPVHRWLGELPSGCTSGKYTPFLLFVQADESNSAVSGRYKI
jgi:hypothetical protein